MSVTVKEVAKRAGVSPATVSRVFTDVVPVTEEKRQAVLKACEELDFTPNFMARALKMKRSFAIGLLVPDIVNSYYSQLARGIEITARSRGYCVLLANSDNQLEREKTYIDWLVSRQVDGIILATVGGETGHIMEANGKVPIVVAGRRPEGLANMDSVTVDNYLIGVKAASHLLQIGHTRIAAITGPKSVSSSLSRLDGFGKTLKEAGVQVPENWIYAGDFVVESGERAIEALYAGVGPKPTAIFCFNDQLAIGAIKALQRKGLQVPSDVSVVGCDDTYIASLSNPELTTIRHPIEEIGEAAVDILLKRIGRKSKRRVQKRLPVELVIRQSSCPPREGT